MTRFPRKVLALTLLAVALCPLLVSASQGGRGGSRTDDPVQAPGDRQRAFPHRECRPRPPGHGKADRQASR